MPRAESTLGNGRNCDCVVIGGGPAGSTVATLLAQKGRRVVLLERSAVPRFHIGESLMPETYWVFQRLGMLEKLKASHFPRKYSVQFVNEEGKESVPFYFFETNPHESSVTWQVWRADFDRMLLENAREHGVEVRTETRVTDVLFEDDRAVGVRAVRTGTSPLAPSALSGANGLAVTPRTLHVTSAGDSPGLAGEPVAAGVPDRVPGVERSQPPAGSGTPAERLGAGRLDPSHPTQTDREPVEIRAKVVVDASGQSSLIANRLGLRRATPGLRKSSVWTYYRGGRRDPGIDEGATLVLHVRDKKGWFWYIPLPDDVVSVGVVGDIDYLVQGRGEPEQIFHEEVARCPAVAERLECGRQFGPYFVTKDFSYHSTSAAGPGWVLVGDALGFLDPIYSSGVFLALKSGEWAADAIHAALEHNDYSAERLGGWGPTFLKGMDSIRKLVYAFYTPEFSFGSFIRQHPDQKKNLVNLLIGDVFKPGVDEIFTLMGEMVPVLA